MVGIMYTQFQKLYQRNSETLIINRFYMNALYNNKKSIHLIEIKK